MAAPTVNALVPRGLALLQRLCPSVSAVRSSLRLATPVLRHGEALSACPEALMRLPSASGHAVWAGATRRGWDVRPTDVKQIRYRDHGLPQCNQLEVGPCSARAPRKETSP